MQSWHRINAAGEVVGIAESDRATAEMNLGPGETLRPANAPLVRQRPRVEDDPDFMRRTAYPDLGEQIGALMKVVPALLAGEKPPRAARDELLALAAQVEAAKAMHPKAPRKT